MNTSEVMDDLDYVFTNRPLSEWSHKLRNLEIVSNYHMVFGAIASTITCVLDYDNAEKIIKWWGEILLSESVTDFLVNKYIPKYKKAIKDVEITWADKINLRFI